MSKFNFKNIIKQNWLILILTLIGAFLRFYNFKSTLVFLGDQGRDAFVVYKLIKEGDPILIGPTTSVGKIQLGPLYYYFMAPFLWLSNFNPIGPAFAVALLGTLTIPVFYFILKKMFNNKVAVIASVLYTFSDIVIANTRGSWNPNPMPFVIILLLYSIYQFYSNKKYSYIIWTFIFFSIALQLHYMVLLLTPMLLAIAFLTFIQNKKDIKEIVKNSLIGLLVFIAFLVPLIIFDLRHNFINYEGFIDFFQKGHHTQNSFSINKIFNSIENRLFEITGNFFKLNTFPQIRRIFSYLFLILFLSLFAKNKKRKEYQIIFITFLTSLLGLTLYEGDVFEHYLTFYYPIPFIVISLIIEKLWNINKFINYLIVFVFILNILLNLKAYRYFNPQGWKIDDIEKVADNIAKDSNNIKYNIILLDDSKDYRGMNYRYFLHIKKSNIADFEDFNNINFIYLITQKEIPDNSDLHIWEFQTFLQNTLEDYSFTKESKFEDFNNIIVNKWYYENGPYVYKLIKS